MQAQYTQYHTMPPQQNMVGAVPAAGQNTSQAPIHDEMNGPFAHLLRLPIFQLYSLKEFGLIMNAIRENLKTKQLRQEVIDNMPPPPTTADAMTAKVVMEYLSIMTDGGTTFVANRFNIDKMMSGTLGMLDAMEQQSMKPSSTVVYSRWASPREMRGAPIIVDVLAWFKVSDRTRMTGVHVKTNTESKVRINAEKAFSVKEGKSWTKTWFRGRDDFLNILAVNSEGVEVKLGMVVTMERDLVPSIFGDFLNRWNEFKVPKV